METISRATADAVRSKVMQTVTVGDVGAKYWRFYDSARTAAAVSRMTEGELRTRSIYAIYLSGVSDALETITQKEPVEEPENEEEIEK